MNAQIQITEELPPFPEVFEIQVDSALGLIDRFRKYIESTPPDSILAYEYKAAETLPVFETILKKLQSWKGDIESLPDADGLIRSLSGYIHGLETIMWIEKGELQ